MIIHRQHLLVAASGRPRRALWLVCFPQVASFTFALLVTVGAKKVSVTARSSQAEHLQDALEFIHDDARDRSSV